MFRHARYKNKNKIQIVGFELYIPGIHYTDFPLESFENSADIHQLPVDSLWVSDGSFVITQKSISR